MPTQDALYFDTYMCPGCSGAPPDNLLFLQRNDEVRHLPPACQKHERPITMTYLLTAGPISIVGGG